MKEDNSNILKNLYDSYKSLKEQFNQAVEFYEKSQLSQMLAITEQQICHQLQKEDKEY